MPTCAEVPARTLRKGGVTRMFGLPGGEILDFMEAARRAGIDFLLTPDEATASFMADVTGQITGVPGISVATLGPGAVNAGKHRGRHRDLLKVDARDPAADKRGRTPMCPSFGAGSLLGA